MKRESGYDALIARAHLRVSFCGYCGKVCLAAKRSLCCGDAVYDDDPSVAEFLSGGPTDG